MNRLNYKFLFCAAVVCCLLIFTNQSYAQSTIIKANGTVTDNKGVNPLFGATVHEIGGKEKTTLTDKNGQFQIAVPLHSRLRVSMEGYKSAEVEVTSSDAISVQLDTSAANLDDVIVIGYTTQKKELLTGAVATVKFKEADAEIPTSSVGNLLAGRMAGVNVSTPNGAPGAQPSISIRTASSWNTAGVLYVIDGRISNASDFNNLAPNEIDEITVLKDAATTAAYGSRAAGGVMVITTKRGKAGKAVVNYSYNTGRDVRGNNEALTSAVQYGVIYNRISGGGPGALGSAWTSADSTYFATHDFGSGLGQGFRQINDVFINPYITTHNINASGGSDKIKYFIGASYVDQSTFIKNTNLKKYNVRANITADLSKNVSVFAGLSLNDDKFAQPGGDWTGDMYSKLLVWQPYMPSYTANRLPVDYFWISNKSAEADGLAGYSKTENIAPVANLNLTYNAPFLAGLSAKASYVKSYYFNDTKNFTHPFTYYQLAQTDPYIWNLDSIVGSRLSAHTPELEKQASWSQTGQLDLQLNYVASFGRHHVSAALVYENYQTSGEGEDAAITGFPIYTYDQWWAATGGSGIINNNANKLVSNTYGTGYTNGRKSYIGQFTYDYAGKYIANFTYRYDGSANFAPDQRWGFFPSGSGAWVISKENFFKNVKGIQMLKLRASLGLTGNDAIGGFQWEDSYIPGNNSFLGTAPTLNPGIRYGVVPNPNITWEKYLNKNIGIDIDFLNNFSSSLDYWRNYTYDILGTRIQTTPPTYSRPLPAVNYGKEIAQGLDFSLNYHNIVGQLSYGVGIVASYGYAWYKQKDQNVTYDYQNQIGDGRTTSMVTGYKVDHMLRTQSDVDAWLAKYPHYSFYGDIPQAGDFVYKDISGPNGKADGTIDDNDYTIIKKRNAPIVGGLHLEAAWKGISISATFNGSFGYLKSFNSLAQGVEWNRMWEQWYANSWTPQNTNAWLPYRYSANAEKNGDNNATSDFWMADASFLRLKSLNIGYDLPQRLYKKYLNGVRFYVSGSNLFIISKFNKRFFDPEIGSGVSFPTVKSFNAGISVTF